MDKTNMDSYYAILNISPSASREVIEKAYFEAKSSLRSNSLASYGLMDSEQPKAILEELSQAYKTLTNPTLRKKYDNVQDQWYSKGLQDVTNLKVQTSIEPEAQEPQTPVHLKKPSVASFDLYIHKEYTTDLKMEEKIEKADLIDGDFLKSVREYKNITIKEMMTYTKLTERYITAMEEMNIQMLPALVYVRGFVTQYAKGLQLNSERIAPIYIRQLQSIQKT